MLQSDFIKRIIDNEKIARRLANESRKELADLDASLAAEYEAMRKSYLERAEKRVKSVEDSENRYADEVIARMDEELRAAIDASEKSAQANGDLWAKKIFEAVIGFPETLK